MAEYPDSYRDLRRKIKETEDVRNEEDLRRRLESLYRYESVFSDYSTVREREENREEVERIIEEVSERSDEDTLVDLAKVVETENPLNPKTLDTTIQTYQVSTKFSRPVPSSSTNAPRYISLSAYNWNALLEDQYTLYPPHQNETGLVIRVEPEPFNAPSGVYDPAVAITDVTAYGSNFVVNPTTLSTTVTSNGDLYILYPSNAFNVTASSYDYGNNNGMLEMRIKVDFQSIHSEIFTIKAPIGKNYSSGADAIKYQSQASASGTTYLRQRVYGCSAFSGAEARAASSSFYSKGAYYIYGKRAPLNTTGILTQWKPVSNPSGLMGNFSTYTQYTSPAGMGLSANATYVYGAWAAYADIGEEIPGAQGLTIVDDNTTAKQELHKIDVLLQTGNTGYWSIIANQNESFYTTNYTSYTTSNPNLPDPYYNIGTTAGGSISSFDNTVAIIGNQTQNQLFTYTVFYSENITSCDPTPKYVYDVCTEKGNPSNFTATSQDCNGQVIPGTHLPGGAVYNQGLVQFNSAECCTTPCSLEIEVIATDATFGNNDGFVSWGVNSTPGDYSTFTGNPFDTNGFYTVLIAGANGVALTGTQAPAGGANFIVAATVNDTAGTANRFTVSSNDQIVTGMQIISGHTFYNATSGGTATTAYVGDVYAGNLSQNATEFYIVDESGNQLYSQSDGTPNLVFGTGYEGLFGALPANTAANPFYIITVEDEDGCQEVARFVINEGTAPTGCTDPTAANYNSSAVVDDGSCILCNQTTGLLENPVTGLTTDLFDSFSFTSTPATHNSGYGMLTTHNSDATLSVSAAPVASVVPYLTYDSDSKFQIKVYKANAYGAASTSGNVTLVQTINAGTLNNVSVAASTITGLEYGWYTLRFEYVDITDTSTMENCFTDFFATVQAEVCDDQFNTNFMGVPHITAPQATFRFSNPNLCDQKSGCTACAVSPPFQVQLYTGGGVTNYYNWNVPLGGPCEPNLYTWIYCDPPTLIGPINLYFDATCNGNYVLVDQLHATQGITVGSATYFTFVNAILNNGTGCYKVEVTQDLGGPNECTIDQENFIQGDTFGCTDPQALNYDANATCPTTCLYESYNCVNGTCSDPGDGSGQYSTLADCQQNCTPTSQYGCTDPCATNYDPSANVDDGSCLFRACLDPVATNQYWSCDCNAQKVNATINDQSCCVTPCPHPETITPTTTNASNTCTTYSNDGSVFIEFSNINGATNWTFEIYDAVGTTLVYADPTTYQNPTTTSNTYSSLLSGVYTAQVTNSFGCVHTEQFTIGSTGPQSGCTDPNADNYDPNAVCDDGTCVICGCPDPNANNYNPNATTICPCDYDVDGATPCVPSNVLEVITKARGCLSLKGTDWLSDYRIGQNTDCPIMDKWKLILIEYLLTRDKEGIDCLFNCANYNLSIENIGGTSCKDLWKLGGPSTGLNHDPNHAGAFLQPGGGTVVTSYDGYPTGWFGYQNPGVGPNVVHYQYTGPARSNLTYVGDVIKFELPINHPLASQLNGTIWELTTLPPATTTWNTMGGHQGCQKSKIQHYTKCGDYTKIDVTETTNYYEKFLNFVNKFCRDCNISILNKKIKT